MLLSRLIDFQRCGYGRALASRAHANSSTTSRWACSCVPTSSPPLGFCREDDCTHAFMTRAVQTATASYAGEAKMIRQIVRESSNLDGDPCRLGVLVV